MTDTKTKRMRLAFILSAAYLVLFLSYYIAFLIYETDSPAVAYVIYALELSLRFITPVVVAAYLLPYTSKIRFYRAIMHALPLALPSLIYNIPYYYLYVSAYGNDWADALIIAIPVCLLEMLLFVLLVALFLFVARLFALAPLKKAITSALPPVKRETLTRAEEEKIKDTANLALGETMAKRGVFDLSIPYVKGIFAAAFVQFIIYIILEVYEIIRHLAAYGSFRTDELTYVIVKLVGIFTVLFITHAISYLLVRWLHGENYEKN